MDKRTTIGTSIDKIKDQYVVCQSNTDENIFYAYYLSYEVSNFFNRKRIKQSMIYVLTVKNGYVVDFDTVDALKLHITLKNKNIKVSDPGSGQHPIKMMLRDFQSVM